MAGCIAIIPKDYQLDCLFEFFDTIYVAIVDRVIHVSCMPFLINRGPSSTMLIQYKVCISCSPQFSGRYNTVYTVDTVTISIPTHVPLSDSTATIAPTLTVFEVYATAPCCADIDSILCQTTQFHILEAMC